jgi:hypothetical protein
VKISGNYWVHERRISSREAIYAERNIEARTCNHCCSEKSISITYSECVFVALDIQLAMRMRHIVLRGVPGSTIFSTISHKRHDFRYTLVHRLVIFLEICLKIFLILRRTERDMIKNQYWSSCKLPVFLNQF